MYTQKNVNYLQIGADVANWSARATSPNALLTGEIGVFTPEGVVITEATAITSASARFIIAARQADGILVTSPVYNKADIVKGTRKVYAAGTVQTDYIGYNGTTGSIDVINNNLYMINIQVQELLRSNSDGRKIKFGLYQSSSSATQAEIAAGLLKSLINNFDREFEKFIGFTMLADHAGAAVGAAADTVVGSVGSTKVVITDTGGDSSVIALAVGDYFRAGTAVTDPVYKIVGSTVAVTGGTLTLDVPLQAAVNLVGTTAEYITAAQMATANCGIKMLGQALSFKTGKFNDEVAMWETQLVDFEDTTQTFKSTAATRGTGTVNQVKQMEWFYQGNEGESFAEPFSTTFAKRTNTDASVAGSGYDMIQLQLESKNVVAFETPVSPQSITLAIPTTATAANYALAATADDITDVLECLVFGSATGAFAIT